MKRQPYPKNEDEWNQYERNRVISGWVSGGVMWIAIIWILLQQIDLNSTLAARIVALENRVRVLETTTALPTH